MKHSRIRIADPAINAALAADELGWVEQRIANAPAVAARIAETVARWRACHHCDGLGYARFDAWNHANDVRCEQCGGRGGERAS